MRVRTIFGASTGILEDAALLGGASPAVGSGVVIAPYSSGELFALRIETGRRPGHSRRKDKRHQLPFMEAEDGARPWAPGSRRYGRPNSGP